MKKNIIFMFFAISLIAVIFSSCKKEEDLNPRGASNTNGSLTARIAITGSITAGDSALIGATLNASGASSTGPIKSWKIYWGDNTNIGPINIVSSNSEIGGSHAYAYYGTYLLRLSVFSGYNATGDSASDYKYIYIVPNLPLVANLSFSGVNVQGDSALLNSALNISGANSTGVVHSYIMDYADGTSSGYVNVSSNAGIVQTKSYSSTGQYPVKLTVFDGYNATGNSSVKYRTLYVVNQFSTPSNYDSLLIKYDSVYLGGSDIWQVKWKLNCQRAFGSGWTNDLNYFYCGDGNGWNQTALTSAPVSGWIYFTTNGTQRFSIINVQGSQQMWAKLTADVHSNEHSLTKWNSFGAISVVCRSNGIFPIWDPGSIGDQLINLNKPATGKIRINVKASPGTFTVTPGMSPGLKILNPTQGVQLLTMTADPSDPFGYHWYVDVTVSDFNGGAIKFWIMQSISQTSTFYFWSGSYWGPNSTDYSYTIPAGVNPPYK